jgi:hypothetical protein
MDECFADCQQFCVSCTQAATPPASGCQLGALTTNQNTINGSTNYQTCSGNWGSTGGVINTSANPVTTNSGPVDASGGNGSFPNILQNIATQGLNDANISASEFGIGSLTDILRTGASGQTTAASAPSAPTIAQAAPPAKTGPLGLPWLLWLAVGAAAVYLIVRK